MRWGVRDEMTNEHMTTALCMNELGRLSILNHYHPASSLKPTIGFILKSDQIVGCQKYSMGPNFIYFGGQKYGYRPIPSEIDTEELTKLIGIYKTH